MLTQRIAIDEAKTFINDLSDLGYRPQKAILFGSFAKGNYHVHSDIDLAIWDSNFTGCKADDYEPIARLLSKHFRIELHTFSLDETEHDNPFIGEITKTGIVLV